MPSTVAPMPFDPAGPLTLRITPWGGAPIDQPLDVERFDPEGKPGELCLTVNGIGQLPLRVESWSPLRACGCGRTADGKLAKVELIAQ